MKKEMTNVEFTIARNDLAKRLGFEPWDKQTDADRHHYLSLARYMLLKRFTVKGVT